MSNFVYPAKFIAEPEGRYSIIFPRHFKRLSKMNYKERDAYEITAILLPLFSTCRK